MGILSTNYTLRKNEPKDKCIKRQIQTAINVKTYKQCSQIASIILIS